MNCTLALPDGAMMNELGADELMVIASTQVTGDAKPAGGDDFCIVFLPPTC